MEQINKNNWKETDLNVDSLWIIDERDKSGKHANVYHGNFIPQVPNQLIRRYTQEGELLWNYFRAVEQPYLNVRLLKEIISVLT